MLSWITQNGIVLDIYLCLKKTLLSPYDPAPQPEQKSWGGGCGEGRVVLLIPFFIWNLEAGSTLVETFAEGEGSALERVASGGCFFFSGFATAATQKKLFHKQKLFWSELCKPYQQHGTLASLWGQVSANRPALSPGYTNCFADSRTNTEGVLHVAGGGSGWQSWPHRSQQVFIYHWNCSASPTFSSGFAAIISCCLLDRVAACKGCHVGGEGWPPSFAFVSPHTVVCIGHHPKKSISSILGFSWFLGSMFWKFCI